MKEVNKTTWLDMMKLSSIIWNKFAFNIITQCDHHVNNMHEALNKKYIRVQWKTINDCAGQFEALYFVYLIQFLTFNCNAFVWSNSHALEDKKVDIMHALEDKMAETTIGIVEAKKKYFSQ